MKKVLVSTLVVSLFASSAALADSGGPACEAAYQEKLERIDKNRFLRKAGQTGLVVGSFVAGVFAPTLFMGPIGVVPGAFISGPAGGMLAHEFGPALDREDGLLAAQAFISQARAPKAEVEFQVYNAHIDERMETINRQMARLGMAPLTREEVIQKVGPQDSLNLKSLVQLSLDDVNKKRNRRGLDALSYDLYQEKVIELTSSDLFCRITRVKRTGEDVRRPLTLGEIQKILIAKLAR